METRASGNLEKLSQEKVHISTRSGMRCGLRNQLLISELNSAIAFLRRDRGASFRVTLQRCGAPTVRSKDVVTDE